jgi:hypothetical protein
MLGVKECWGFSIGDFSELRTTNYIFLKNKIKIHGFMWYTSLSTSRRPNMTQEQYIEKVSRKYNNKYDYSKTTYLGSNQKIIVICPEHGEFKVLAGAHAHASECLMCNKRDRFFKQVKLVYGDKYDYSSVSDFSPTAIAKIRCPEHGEFECVISGHMYKNQGCPRCPVDTIKLPMEPRKKYASSNTKNTKKHRSQTGIVLLSRLTARYGHLYDFSNTTITNQNDNITLNCMHHGPFTTTPKTLFRNLRVLSIDEDTGCPRCRTKLTNDKLYITTSVKLLNDFIDEMTRKYPDKFDYSLVTVASISSLLDIKCNTCGSTFKQTRNQHKTSGKCPVCCDTNSVMNIIQKASKVHNNKYSYSLVSAPSGIQSIQCPEHGEFKQNIISHANGMLCPKCQFNDTELHTLDTKLWDMKSFIEKSIQRFGSQYDYSKLSDEIMNSPETFSKLRFKMMTFNCTDHGEFQHRISNHLNSITGGCPECLRLYRENEMILKFKEVHGDRYDYSNTKYEIGNGKVTIICPKCGPFVLDHSAHVYGRGCQKCGFSKGELLVSQALNEFGLEYEYEHTFDDLRGERNIRLPIDFYIPNKHVCIEYDGEQHFKSYPRFGGDAGLIRTQRNDKIKNEYCSSNNIPMIRIPYDVNTKDAVREYILYEFQKLGF